MSVIQPYFRTIKQLLQGQSYSIDEYQREYKWDASNINELLSDLLQKFENEHREGDDTQKSAQYEQYFLGSIIVSQRAEKSYLVDGQQRITSLTLLLLYLYRASVDGDLGMTSTLEPLIFSDNFGAPQFNLAVDERLPTLRALYEGNIPSADGQPESVATMIQRYDDIVEFDLIGELGGAFRSFIYWLINRVGVIEIVTDSDEQAFVIFETMNDRGKPLSPVDMLKAYMLAPIRLDDERRHANATWKRTIQDLVSAGEESDPERDATALKAWFRAQYAESVRERRKNSKDRDWELIGRTFHRWIRDNERAVGTGTADRNYAFMTGEFPFLARAYSRILHASANYTPGLEAVRYNAHNDFTWQPTVALAPLIVGDDEATIDAKISLVATYLDIWLMRRVVNFIRVGYSTVNYAMYLLVRDIRHTTVPDLAAILETRLAEDDVTFRGGRGRSGIIGLGLNQFTARYIYHLLARITAYVEQESGGHDLFASYIDRSGKHALDIEHIAPDVYSRYRADFADQGEFARWRNGIGGLLLLPADVNRSLQAKPYEQKIKVYARQNRYAASLSADSAVNQPQFNRLRSVIGASFDPQPTFGLEAQNVRADLVLRLSELIWSPERLAEVVRAWSSRQLPAVDSEKARG